MDNVPKNGQLCPAFPLYFWTVSDELHTRIRRVREQAGFSQEEMAEMLGVGRTTYINFETGRSRLLHHLLEPMAERLGLSLEELLFGPRDDRLLEDGKALQLAQQSLRDEYEQRFAAMDEQLRAANQVIEAQGTTIRTLTDANQFLMKQLNKDD